MVSLVQPPLREPVEPTFLLKRPLKFQQAGTHLQRRFTAPNNAAPVRWIFQEADLRLLTGRCSPPNLQMQEVAVVSGTPPAVFMLSQKCKLRIVSRFCFMLSDPLFFLPFFLEG